jgi:hypothetical protein
MAKSVLIAGNIQATNIDTLVKFGKASVEVENGNIVVLGDLATGTRENEVYVASTPSALTTGTPVVENFYIVNEPVNVLVDGLYTGLSDDPTKFSIGAGKVFTCVKFKVGDEMILSEDGMTNAIASNTHIVPAGDSLKFKWVTDTTDATLVFKKIADAPIEIPTGTFYDRTKKGYKFLCILA